MRLGYSFREKEFFMRRNGLPLRAHGLLTQNGHAEETQNFLANLGIWNYAVLAPAPLAEAELTQRFAVSNNVSDTERCQRLWAYR